MIKKEEKSILIIEGDSLLREQLMPQSRIPVCRTSNLEGAEGFCSRKSFDVVVIGDDIEGVAKKTEELSQSSYCEHVAIGSYLKRISSQAGFEISQIIVYSTGELPMLHGYEEHQESSIEKYCEDSGFMYFRKGAREFIEFMEFLEKIGTERAPSFELASDVSDVPTLPIGIKEVEF